MGRHGIRALAGGRFRPCTIDSRHYLPVAPNSVWLADITNIATGEGPCSTSRPARPFGWAMRGHMRTELPLAALMMAAQRQRPATGLVCHSDQGSQYASETYESNSSPCRRSLP
jgi:putative transposase